MLADIHLALTSPRMHGPKVKTAQHLLAHNRFNDFDPGGQDGVYGLHTAAATNCAKYRLGFPGARVNYRFGPLLYVYLVDPTNSHAQRRPAAYLARATIRVRILKRRERTLFR